MYQKGNLSLTGGAAHIYQLSHLYYSGAYGVVSMCIGTGMGAAAVLQYEQ